MILSVLFCLKTPIVKYNVKLKQIRIICSNLSIFQNSNRSYSEKVKQENINVIEDKIVYNSTIKHNRNLRNTFDDNVLKLNQLQDTGPICLASKYFNNDCANEIVSKKEEPGILSKYDKYEFNLPYKRYHNVNLIKPSSSDLIPGANQETRSTNESNNPSFVNLKDKYCRPSKEKWMKDYNKYTEVSVNQTEEEEEEIHSVDSWALNYGSADTKIPSSTVPCGGCGAHLHCQDSAIPGYLPKEIFIGLNKEQLQAVVCQRCHFLREYNIALAVSVNPETYPQLLSKIKERVALVILVVDMTDFPCSIWPGILDVIGPKRPLIVVGNKIDLLQDWSKDMLEKAKQALVKQLPPKANILHVTLVSAKTGFGVEKLVTSLYNLWEYRGDVYLIGCTNVGKSTLFNALLQSDYCKSKAADLLLRATTDSWPGTTLNLLKFPIMRPEGWKLAMRNLRLREQNSAHNQGRKLQPTPQTISIINRTFAHENTQKYSDDQWEDPFFMPKMKTLKKLKGSGSGLDPDDPAFAKSKWLYDTPGVITPDQIINLLTTEELMLTLPREPIIPRTFQVWPGQSLLVAGIGRLDYVTGSTNIKMTVLSANNLPVTICYIKDTEDVYHHYLGSDVLAVPCGDQERLKQWPGLSAGPQFVLKGIGWNASCADVVLSSAGWIAVTIQQDTMCQMQAWTPSARGIHIRVPPVLPHAIALKGCKLFKTQAYALFNNYKKNVI